MKIKIIVFVIALSNMACAQTRDTVLIDGEINAIGSSRKGKRIGIWEYNFVNGKSYKTVEYLESGKAYIKYFDDNDFIQIISIDAIITIANTIPNNDFYLKNYLEARCDSTYKCVAEGKYYTYYPTGGIYEQGNKINGERDGEWRRNYRSGFIANIINFANGDLNGKWLSYYEGKILMVEGRYIKNAKEGYWKEYYPNGQIKAEGSYNEDIAPLKITEQNIKSCQQILPEVNLEPFLHTGLPFNYKSRKWIYYSEEGKLKREEFYEKGKMVNFINY